VTNGWVAWVLWGIVHIFFLIGFRNRAAVFLNWAWAWVTYGRGARLITGEMTTLAPDADSTESKRPGATSPCGTNLELPPKP
jgi:NADH:ubiquinone reductase (H+-translocating)